MSLYVRVSCGFWTHRKTLRLSAILGPQHSHIPIRLWCYAAENQPDGDFEKYLPEELALLVGYLGDAQAMLQALQQAGFLDGMKVHGWEEHNSYHTTFSERAKKAAKARWDKTRKEKEGQERKGKEASNASSINTEKKDNLPTSDKAKKLADLFKRRHTTAWDDSEIKKFKVVSKHPEEDFALVVDYYEKSNSPYLRQDLGTFLNNFSGELDRARAWKAGKLNGSHRPTTPNNPRVTGTANANMCQQYAGIGRVSEGTGNPANGPKG
jgi:hypothetical protein